MDEKISLKALDDFSDDFASKVTASFFLSKEKITGPEILKVTEVQQVNLMILHELLGAWKLESNKLKSPFFDYTAREVTAALEQFQNVLSNHISISRENFQPLLKKAVRQTLYLILDPYDFFADTLDQVHGGHVRIEDLRSQVRFLRINRLPLERLLETLDNKKLVTVPGNEAFAMLDHILEEVNFTPEDVEPYLQQLSRVVPVRLEAFYEGIGEPAAPVTLQKESAAPIQVEQPVSKKGPEIQKEQPKPAPKPEPDIKKGAGAQTTLYDQLARPSTSTLAEDFQKRKKIKDSLTINQKFMFTKILFNGDFELFSDAIERLDQLDNIEQALSYLSNNHSEWNKDTEEYEEFMEIVQRRFA